MISEIGSAAVTEAGAKQNARTNWRRKVIFTYGETFSDFARARDGVEGPCVKTLIGLTRCEARGRPCAPENAAPSGGGGIREIACDARRDSKNCDPGTKWVQTVLNQAGCKTSVDGSAGKGTVAAVKCFQKKNNLPDTGDSSDPRVLQALAAAYKPKN